MHGAHAGMQLVDEEFTALVEDLAGALGALKVGKRERDEIMGALGPLKGEIVEPPPPEARAHDAALEQVAAEQSRALRASGHAHAADRSREGRSKQRYN